jgi:hypothetical protein
MVTNQITMIGPKKVETVSVPRFCITNRPTMMARVVGTTKGENPGATSDKPSTADRTDMAGVMIASPKNSEIPMTPMPNSHAGRLSSACWISAISDSVPPSPRLSARMISSTYLIVTMMISVQIRSEITP